MNPSLIAVAVSAAVLCSSFSAHAQNADTRDLTVQGRVNNASCGAPARDLQLTPQQAVAYQVCAPRPASAVQNASLSPLNITAWVDKESNTYAIGESVRLFVKSNKDAYVTVLNVGPSGNTTVLFPNQYQQNNFIAANQVREIPGQGSPAMITVGGPVGRELIKVVASSKAVPLFQPTQLEQAGPWQTVNVKVDSWGRDLQVTMNQQPTRISQQAAQAVEWDSFDKVIRTVEPATQAYYVAPQQAPNIQVVVNTAPQPMAQPQVQTQQAMWSHQAVVNEPFPFTVAMQKNSFRAGEPAQIMISAASACALSVTATDGAGHQITLVSGGAQGVVQPGQAILISAPSGGAGGQYRLDAVCNPTAANRDIVTAAPAGGGAPAAPGNPARAGLIYVVN